MTHKYYNTIKQTIQVIAYEIIEAFVVELSMMGDTFIKKIKILLQLYLVKVEQWRFSQKILPSTLTTNL